MDEGQTFRSSNPYFVTKGLKYYECSDRVENIKIYNKRNKTLYSILFDTKTTRPIYKNYVHFYSRIVV